MWHAGLAEWRQRCAGHAGPRILRACVRSDRVCLVVPPSSGSPDDAPTDSWMHAPRHARDQLVVGAGGNVSLSQVRCPTCERGSVGVPDRGSAPDVALGPATSRGAPASAILDALAGIESFAAALVACRPLLNAADAWDEALETAVRRLSEVAPLDDVAALAEQLDALRDALRSNASPARTFDRFRPPLPHG